MRLKLLWLGVCIPVLALFAVAQSQTVTITVLRIDGDDPSPSRFIKTAEPYSPAVAGVYSTKPGVLGRRQTTPKSAEEIPLAIVGIVPVKVTTENGPIRPYDLLVSSSTLGYAMKGTDRSRMLGAVIGRQWGHLTPVMGL